MNAALKQPLGRPSPCLVIEGYASVFSTADQTGDVVRAGAFARSLRARSVPMLLQHKSGAIAGTWSRMVEDGRGLFVRGLVSASAARTLVETVGLNGLSIGFRPRIWSPNSCGGRTLAEVDLIEVSLVSEPMHPMARFVVV